MTNLQSLLLSHMDQLGITREQIKKSKKGDLPYPVNSRYIWYLTKGIIKGQHTAVIMADFFNNLKTIENGNDKTL